RGAPLLAPPGVPDLYKVRRRLYGATRSCREPHPCRSTHWYGDQRLFGSALFQNRSRRRKPSTSRASKRFQCADNRAGWIECLRLSRLSQSAALRRFYLAIPVHDRTNVGLCRGDTDSINEFVTGDRLAAGRCIVPFFSAAQPGVVRGNHSRLCFWQIAITLVKLLEIPTTNLNVALRLMQQAG